MSTQASAGQRDSQTPPGAGDARKDEVTLPCFDGLRGFAAILVVGYHAIILLNPTGFGPRFLHAISQTGTTALTMFFLISGCLLYRPFVLAHFQSRKPPRATPFLKRRMVRIFPGYWLALTIAVYVLHTYSIPNTRDFVTLYGLVQNYRVGYLKAGLNVSWTLVIEVVYYLSLPLLAWLIRRPSALDSGLRRKVAVQLAGLLAIYALVHAIRVWILWVGLPPPGPYGSWFSWQRFLVFPLSYYDWLALGMVLAVVSAWLGVGQELPRWIAKLGSNAALCWLLALGCYGLILSLRIVPRATTPEKTMALVFLQGVVALLMVLPAVIGPQDRGGIRRFLRSRPMALLGTVSYGVYLWHLTFLKEAKGWAEAGFLPDDPLFQFVVAAALTLAAACVSYFALELPLIRWAQSKRPAKA